MLAVGAGGPRAPGAARAGQIWPPRRPLRLTGAALPFPGGGVRGRAGGRVRDGGGGHGGGGGRAEGRLPLPRQRGGRGSGGLGRGGARRRQRQARRRCAARARRPRRRGGCATRGARADAASRGRAAAHWRRRRAAPARGIGASAAAAPAPRAAAPADDASARLPARPPAPPPGRGIPNPIALLGHLRPARLAKTIQAQRHNLQRLVWRLEDASVFGAKLAKKFAVKAIRPALVCECRGRARGVPRRRRVGRGAGRARQAGRRLLSLARVLNPWPHRRTRRPHPPRVAPQGSSCPARCGRSTRAATRASACCGSPRRSSLTTTTRSCWAATGGSSSSRCDAACSLQRGRPRGPGRRRRRPRGACSLPARAAWPPRPGQGLP
jgi:hypothetical protein